MAKLFIKKDPKMGRGLFAKKHLKKGSIVEVSELIILSKKDTKEALKTMDSLSKFLFDFGKNKVAIALGKGSLFNHSKKSNVSYAFKGKKLYFFATKDIKKNTQLFIDYGYDPVEHYG